MDDPLSFTPAQGLRKLTPQRQRDFIVALAASGLVSQAAQAIGVSVAALEKLRYDPAGASFRAAWDAARRAAKANGAFKRALHTARRGESALICHSVRPSTRTSRAAFIGPEPDADDPLLGFRPYFHARPRRNSITPDRQRAFISTLAATGSVTPAARSIGASLEALYKLRARKGAEQFASAWDKAVDCGIARLEDSALIRAIEGELRPVVRGGEVVAHYRTHNEALTMFMLRHRRPHRYGSESERSRAEAVLDEEEIIASINRKLDLMRERMQQAAALENGGDDGAG